MYFSYPCRIWGRGGTASSDKAAIDENKAIAMVLAKHPYFPLNHAGTEVKSQTIGGRPPGVPVSVKYIIQVNKVAESNYEVTLLKDWGLTVNGSDVKSTWKYKVKPGGVRLLKKVDNDWRAELVK